MATSSLSETKRVRYLLGLCSPAEREHIESEFLEDDDAFQEMLTAEDDLIDAYARGELMGEERRRFEKNFLRSVHGRDRVQFARAFAGVVSATPSVETKVPDTLRNIAFPSPALSRAATISAVIVFVTVFAWLVNDRRRMTSELRELRAHSAELSKQFEALQRSSDTKRTPAAEIAAQHADLRAQPNKPRHRERGTTAQPARHLPEVTNLPEKIASNKPEQAKPITTTQANSFEPKQITQLPLDARSVPSLLTLQPATTRGGYVARNRADQVNQTFEVAEANPRNIYFVTTRNTGSSIETTIRIPTSLSLIRFQLALETAAIHEDYRGVLKTADGRPITSVDWTEPLPPIRTIIDTPVIATPDLSSGDYVLLLLGKEPDGSFIKVAEYSFKVIRY